MRLHACWICLFYNALVQAAKACEQQQDTWIVCRAKKRERQTWAVVLSLYTSASSSAWPAYPPTGIKPLALHGASSRWLTPKLASDHVVFSHYYTQNLYTDSRRLSCKSMTQNHGLLVLGHKFRPSLHDSPWRHGLISGLEQNSSIRCKKEWMTVFFHTSACHLTHLTCRACEQE